MEPPWGHFNTHAITQGRQRNKHAAASKEEPATHGCDLCQLGYEEGARFLSPGVGRKRASVAARAGCTAESWGCTFASEPGPVYWGKGSSAAGPGGWCLPCWHPPAPREKGTAPCPPTQLSFLHPSLGPLHGCNVLLPLLWDRSSGLLTATSAITCLGGPSKSL